VDVFENMSKISFPLQWGVDVNTARTYFPEKFIAQPPQWYSRFPLNFVCAVVSSPEVTCFSSLRVVARIDIYNFSLHFYLSVESHLFDPTTIS
jgi:hypothetical protein